MMFSDVFHVNGTTYVCRQEGVDYVSTKTGSLDMKVKSLNLKVQKLEMDKRVLTGLYDGMSDRHYKLFESHRKLKGYVIWRLNLWDQTTEKELLRRAVLVIRRFLRLI